MTPEETVNEFVKRVVAKDLDGACELVTADIEYDNVPMGKNYGPDGIKAVLGRHGRRCRARSSSSCTASSSSATS